MDGNKVLTLLALYNMPVTIYFETALTLSLNENKRPSLVNFKSCTSQRIFLRVNIAGVHFVSEMWMADSSCV